MTKAGAPRSYSRRCRFAAGRRRTATVTARQERRPVAHLRDIKGKIGGGEAIVNMDARQAAVASRLNARVQFGGARRQRLALSRADDAAGRVSMQATLAAGPQRVGADRRVIGRRHGDAAIRQGRGIAPRASKSRSAPAITDRRLRTRGCGRLSSRVVRRALSSPLRRYRSRSGRRMRIGAPRSMPPACACCSGGYDIPPTS